MITENCKKCWFQECGRCYNKTLGEFKVTFLDNENSGLEITDDLVLLCNKDNCFESKRKIYSKFIDEMNKIGVDVRIVF